MADTTKHLLLVDDETALREAIAERLADHGFIVEQASSGEEALARLADFAFDILVTDLRLPGVDGRAVLDAALERYPEIIAIIITGFGTVKDAVNAIKQGAADFITKPFQFDALLHVLTSAVEQRRLRSENAYLRSQRARFTTTARAATIASSPSTAARFPKRSSKRSCSATFAAHSRAPSAHG